MSEIWKAVDKFPQYEVNNLGNIRAVFGEPAEVFTNKQGYLTIKVHHNCYLNVHIAVSQAFLTKPDYRMVLSHIDGDKTNNHTSNLCYVFRKKSISTNDMWRDIPGYEGRYQVSRKGEIKSLERYITTPAGDHRYIKGGIRKLVPNNEGFLTVLLGQNCFRVQSLVAKAFLTAEPGKILVHLNGKKTDNRTVNLKYLTRAEAHALRNPTKMSGRRKRRKSDSEQDASPQSL